MRIIVREGETLAMLSARTGAPACMLMRANGIFSPAWLLPGREIVVPEPDFCRKHPAGICPVRAGELPAWDAEDEQVRAAAPETVREAARESGLPPRLHLIAHTRDVRLPGGCRTITVHYGETWESLAEKTHSAAEDLMRINRLWSLLLPGMRIAVRQDSPI